MVENSKRHRVDHMRNLTDKEYSQIVIELQDYLNENFTTDEEKKQFIQNWTIKIDREEKIDELLKKGNWEFRGKLMKF